MEKIGIVYSDEEKERLREEYKKKRLYYLNEDYILNAIEQNESEYISLELKSEPKDIINVDGEELDLNVEFKVSDDKFKQDWSRWNELKDELPVRISRDEMAFSNVPIALFDDIKDGNSRAKTLLLYCFFDIYQDRTSTCRFTLKELSEWFGKPVRYDRGSIFDYLKDSIKYLETKGFIENNRDDLKPSNVTLYNFGVNTKETFEEHGRVFGCIYKDEIDKLISNKKKSDIRYIETTVYILAFIRSYMFVADEFARKRRRGCYLYMSQISDKTKIDEDVLTKIIHLIFDLDILFVEKGIYNPARNKKEQTIFCDMYLRSGRDLLDCGKKFVMENVNHLKEKLSSRK